VKQLHDQGFSLCAAFHCHRSQKQSFLNAGNPISFFYDALRNNVAQTVLNENSAKNLFVDATADYSYLVRRRIYFRVPSR
jgi:hypothetical protein